MVYYVYILKSESTDRYYIGSTGDIEKRLKEHNAGKTRSIKAFRPYRLIYKEELPTNREARQREYFIKSQKSRKFIESLIHRGVA